MGRNAKFNRDDAVRQTMEYLWSHGFEATSVKTLSEQLGITRSSFYHAFGTMEGLAEEAFALYFSMTPDNAWKHLPDGTRILPVITKVFRRICHVLTQNSKAKGCLEANCIAELVGTNDQLGDYLTGALLARVEHIEHLLQTAVAQGELPRETDIPTLALIVQSQILGISVLSKIVSDEDALWSIAYQFLTGQGLYAPEDTKNS